ncbi:MAG: ACP S-malonyltransferase [Bacteroidetes bacterium]|nr:ACP S-malonyltransferase [Bacteroidota bacterium]NCQ10921.1 ACP S-malonyltransferase [Bacteroidota bacterium]
MSTSVLFPGQGSQFVGMGKEFYNSSDSVKKRFNQANEILGFDLKEIMFNGPDEDLKQTEYTQPAIFLHSIAIAETILDLNPEMTAGHSLGEFTALVYAGVISFEDGLKLVRKRGMLMQDAGIKNPGAMAAVIGMDDAKVVEICKNASAKSTLIVVPANFNSPGQLVISGHDEAVDEALIMLKDAGCKIAKKLPVSGAFHSPLMSSALIGLKESLNKVTFSTAKFPVYSNFTAEPSVDGSVLKNNVLQQLLSPVQWTNTMIAMRQNGATEFIEIGPGKVLQGLVKRTLKNVEIKGFQK